MAANTRIEWCDSTANYWRGCTKVSEEKNGGGGCDSCYAEAMNNWLHGGENWGPGAPRHKYDTTSRIVRSWQRNAAKFRAEHGRRRRVFVNSTADTFDNEVEQAWREEIWDDIRACPDLLFMVLTKRIGNARDMLPTDWGDGYPNVMLLATVVNQREADRDVPKLLDLPARWRGISIEPQLGPIDLLRVNPVSSDYGNAICAGDALRGVYYQRHHLPPDARAVAIGPLGAKLDLVINGGESGRRARPSHPDWFRSLRDQCELAGTPYLFKQVGEWAAREAVEDTRNDPPRSLVYVADHDMTYLRAGKARTGRLLDGREHINFPKDFQ